jgi:prepilin-type N-terminal cleavage/methylation domain-containing protein
MSKVKAKGFSLLELLIVVIVLSILAVIALPMFNKAVRSVRQQEAFSMLKLIEQAQKVYRLENTEYYPDVDTDNQSDPDIINQNLSLDLNERYWDFTVYSTGCAQAVHDTEQWHMNVGDDEPTSGTCS